MYACNKKPAGLKRTEIQYTSFKIIPSSRSWANIDTKFTFL